MSNKKLYILRGCEDWYDYGLINCANSAYVIKHIVIGVEGFDMKQNYKQFRKLTGRKSLKQFVDYLVSDFNFEKLDFEESFYSKGKMI